MKKHFVFLASAALVIAASCNKAEIDTPVEGAPVETELISVQLNPETKTSLSGMETVWSEGDAVSVTVGGKNIGTLELVEGNTFSGEIEAGHDGEAVLNYPAGVTSVPAEQAAVAGTFANGAALLKGTTTLAALRAGEGATLSNTTALLSFSVAVAGDVVFTLGEATYTVKGCKAGETYYACVAPVAGAALSYTVAGADGLKSKAGVTFEAGLVYELGELSVLEADPTTIYLVPGAWGSDGAWFAVSYGGSAYKMDINDDGYYTCIIPGSVESFAFWRMNPASDNLAATNRWNEIPNVVVPTGENNYYIWSNWNAPFGAWGPKPAEKTFGIVGEFDWNNDIQMEKVASGVYAAKNVTQIAPFTKWKIRVNGGWDESYTSAITGIEANKWVAIGGSGDLTHAVDGAIDIYIDIKQSRIYVMSAGTDYSTAVQQTVSTTPPPSGLPARDGCLYLRPNSNWTQAGARFAAYFFGNGEKWVSMTEFTAGIYEVEIPTDKTYPSVIFCRMNPGNATNNWNNRWNQTSNLTVPTNGNNLYTVKDNTWSEGGGTWSTEQIF